MSELKAEYRVSYTQLASTRQWDVAQLLEEKVRAALLDLVAEADRIVEDFLVSGAMPRDLSILEGEAVLTRWDVWHAQQAHFVVSKPWRIN